MNPFFQNNMMLELICVSCTKSFDIEYSTNTSSKCPHCHFYYEIRNGSLIYNFRYLLFKNFGKAYLKNAVLNNNGLLSYIYLKEGSIALHDRPDVARFREFIFANDIGKELLDIGSGTMDIPGYLLTDELDKYRLYGLDPIDNENFKGFKVNGCGEFIPFRNEKFDTIFFATSLDHLVSISKTLKECHRVLKRDGSVFVWMSDNKANFVYRIVRKLISSIKYLVTFHFNIPLGNFGDATTIGPYRIYDNYHVFYVPFWAVDPFHSYLEDPQKIIKLFQIYKFKLISYSKKNNDEVFLYFKKR
jgi:SAM-dependent methyltransferase